MDVEWYIKAEPYRCGHGQRYNRGVNLYIATINDNNDSLDNYNNNNDNDNDNNNDNDNDNDNDNNNNNNNK